MVTDDGVVRLTLKEHLTTPATYGMTYLERLSMAAGKHVAEVFYDENTYSMRRQTMVVFVDGTNWVLESREFGVSYQYLHEQIDVLEGLLSDVNKAPAIDKLFIRRRLGLV